MNDKSMSDGVKTVIAGGAAGVMAAVLVCPLDVVKIRMQNQLEYKGKVYNANRTYYKNLRQGLSDIWRTEGVNGLYRGLVPTVFAYLANWSIYFLAYDGVKQLGSYTFGWQPYEAKLHVLASALAGLIGTTATAPCWIIRTRVMTQPAVRLPESPYFYTGMLDAVRTIYKTEGVRSFYRGLLPSLFGVMHVVVQFPIYEQLKILGTEYWSTSEASDAHSSHVNSKAVVFASAASKFFASAVTYPHEILRTRLQTQTGSPSHMTSKPQYKGVVDAALKIAKYEGVAGYYRGFGTNLIRTVPASAITLLVYEWLKQELGIGIIG